MKQRQTNKKPGQLKEKYRGKAYFLLYYNGVYFIIKSHARTPLEWILWALAEQVGKCHAHSDYWAHKHLINVAAMHALLTELNRHSR